MSEFIRKFTSKREGGSADDGQYLDGERVADVNFFVDGGGDKIPLLDARFAPRSRYLLIQYDTTIIPGGSDDRPSLAPSFGAII